MKKAVGYLRRSTDRQEQSLEDQKREIISFAKNENFEIAGWYVDDAISGAFSENRNQFQQLIQTAQSKDRKFDYIFAYDVSRFSRGDNIEVGHYLYLLRKVGVEVLYVKENLKGDDVDEILRPVFQFNANLFLKGLSRDTIRGQVSSARTGNFLGGPIPYGYKKAIGQNGKSTLALDDDLIKVKIVGRIFKLYTEQGYGFRHIAEMLNQEQIPSPRSGTWASSCIRSILMNPVYYGAYVWNRRTLSKFYSVRNGQAEKKPRTLQDRVRENPESEWFVKESTYPAIVSKEFWQLTQSKRKTRDKTPARDSGRTTISPYLLSGLITCANCGHTYFGTTKRNQKHIRTRSYVCGGYWSRGNAVCGNFSFAGSRLENHIVKGIERRLSNESPYMDLLKEIREDLLGRFQDPDRDIKTLELKARAVSKKIDDLLDAIDPEHKELLNRKLSELSNEKKRMEAEIAKLKTQEHSTIDIEKVSKEILGELHNFERIFEEEAPINERKIFIHRYIGAIQVVPKEKKALVGWYSLPKPSSPIRLVAGRGFEPLTSRL